VRGGALPVIVWGCLLGALMATNAIWTGDTIQIGDYAYAMLTLIAIVVALALASHRVALRRGAPERDGGPDALPDISFGAALAAVGFGALIFGLAFGHFFIYFGAGLMLIGLLRVGIELRSQRRSLREYSAAGESTPSSSGEDAP
jgi:cation transport ATPase